MQLALRQAYGWGGLGQSGETDVEGGGWFGGSWEGSGTGSGESGGYAPGATNVPLPPIDPETGQYMVYTQTDPIPIIPYGTPGGQMTGPVPPLDAAKLAQSIAAGTVVLAKSLTGAAGIAAAKCSSGYATPQGACVPVAGIAGGAPLITGVSNQTLVIVGFAFLMLVMVGGRRR